MGNWQELLCADDDTIREAVEHADPMVLRGLLYQLTQDEELITIEVGRSDQRGTYGDVQPPDLIHQADVARLRDKAAAFLRLHRDQGAGEIDMGSRALIDTSLALTAGEDIPENERGIWFEQSGLDPWARGLEWKDGSDRAAPSDFTVAVIGSGLSGLAAAVQLKRAGINFVVLEKNADVGGAWFENRYPGARVDSPSRIYGHIFGLDFAYPYAFCPQEDNLRYMRWVVDRFGISGNIETETEVTSLVWDDRTQQWEIRATGPVGERVWRVNAVISCVGFLSRPKWPEIVGMDSFEGVSCHTAAWPDGLDVAGKRVAVIGAGASAYQTLPVIAKSAGHAYLFQRTPSWCYGNPTYLNPLPEPALWLERNFPYYSNFARFRLSYGYGPAQSHMLMHVEPGFQDEHALSPLNKRLREDCVAFINSKLPGRPDLAEKMTPKAPPMSSRPVAVGTEDNVYDALMRDNVTLVSEPIERVIPTGLRAGGIDYDVDMIVYATGFKADEFLMPMEVRGRNGVRVQALWEKDGPRAYLGTMLPGFPNFFMAYGPNTNPFGGLQVIDLVEIVVRFALQCIGGLIEQDQPSVEVSEDAYWRYNREVDLAESKMIYMDDRANNYFRNRHGRSSVNSPIDYRRMWHWLRDPVEPSRHRDAVLEPYFGGDLVLAGKSSMKIAS